MRRAAMALAMSMLVSVLWIRPVHAEDPDGWSVVFTPQVWLSHISKNGFAAPPKLSTFGIGEGDVDRLNIVDSRPDSINPQAGAQIALQKGRWTIALAGQFTSFTTKNSSSLPEGVVLEQQIGLLSFTPPTVLTYIGAFPARTPLIRESIETDRADFDLALSYFTPDAVKDWFDLSVGIGLKYIYADATRRLTSSVSETLSSCGGVLTPDDFFITDITTCRPVQVPGRPSTVSAPGYLVCKKDDCSDAKFKSTVTSRSYFYGVTFPTSIVFHLSRDKRWLLPLSASFFLGAETRDDHDVVYAGTPDSTSAYGIKVNRLDGTTFAYGVTSDISVRYLFEVGNVPMSAYAGMRVQAIKGHEQFLAYGPIIGMSVRFGK